MDKWDGGIEWKYVIFKCIWERLVLEVRYYIGSDKSDGCIIKGEINERFV